MIQMPNLSPSALFAMVRITLLVLFGRRPAVGSFDASPRGLWQAIFSSVIFTVLVTIYPALETAPELFISAIVLQFIGIMLLVLVFSTFLKAIDRHTKFLTFVVPFLLISVEPIFYDYKVLSGRDKGKTKRIPLMLGEHKV